MSKDDAIAYLIEAGRNGAAFVNVPRDVLLALEDKPKGKKKDAGNSDQPAGEV